MSEATRQQRRKAHREYIKLGRAALAGGLAAHPPREAVLGVALLFKTKLTERGNDRRASETAGMAQALIERSLAARPPKSELACRKGCAYCCHSFVGVIPPEVFRLADAVRAGREGTSGAEAVRHRCEPLKGFGPQDRIGRKLPCPLLVDGLCSVYADRPTVCRQTTSMALTACVDEYENRDRSAVIPVSPLHLAHAGNAHVALLGAIQSVGFSADAYELSAALDIALAAPDAERRWLAGENLFRDLPSVSRPSELERVARLIAGEIAV